jgi:cytidylate kinase
MYRAVTWLALHTGTDVHDEAAVTALAQNARIDVRPPSKDDGRTADVIVNGRDVTWEIRRQDVESMVSVVAAYPGVRAALTEQQRRIGMRGRVVMVGRDIGTVVLPEADLKIYLDASVEERARRRFAELQARGVPAVLEEIAASMRRRDELDSTRQVAPLRAAEDAVRINSDGMSIEEVLACVKALCAREEAR